MRGKIIKPMSFRMNKEQRAGSDKLYSSHVNDGVDFKPKPCELESILKYMDALEAKQKGG